MVIAVIVSWDCYSQPTISWQKLLGGSKSEESYCIINTIDGGYLVAGLSASFDGDIFGNKGGADIWLVKLSNQGTIQWKKNYGGSQNDLPSSIIQTTDGGYLITGFTASNDLDVSGNHGGNFDAWAVKINSLGHIQWSKVYGGSDSDSFYSAFETAEKGFILAGRSRSNDGDLELNHGEYDAWIIKVDSTGSILWNNIYGGSRDEQVNKIIGTIDGDYLALVETVSSDGDVGNSKGGVDFWFVKLSENGDIVWEKSFGGEGSDFPADIIQTSDGSFVSVGFVTSSNTGDIGANHGAFDYWVNKISPSGELIWQNVFGGTGPDWARKVIQIQDEGFLIAGTAGSDDGDVTNYKGSYDYWLVKVNNEGELIWQSTYGGSELDACFDISPTFDGGFILSGYSWSDNDGDLTGITNHGRDDYWVVKLTPEATETKSLNLPKLSISPNPASRSISLQGLETENEVNVTISNFHGQTILQKQMSPDEQINVSNLPKGHYLVSAIGENNKTYLGKLEKL